SLWTQYSIITRVDRSLLPAGVPAGRSLVWWLPVPSVAVGAGLLRRQDRLRPDPRRGARPRLRRRLRRERRRRRGLRHRCALRHWTPRPVKAASTRARRATRARTLRPMARRARTLRPTARRARDRPLRTAPPRSVSTRR